MSQLRNLYGVSGNRLEECDVIILSVKPQDFENISSSLLGITEKLVVSLMAGIRLERIESSIEKSNRVLRIMTNTPIVVDEGMSVMAKGRNVLAEDVSWAERILSNSGKVLALDENLMDSVTSVSGSGPAYFFAFVEALTKTAVKLGIPSTDAEILVRQTFLGSAKLLDERNESASKLKRDVTSPGGTTEAALSIFESMNLQQLFDSALAAAKERSTQLSRLN